MTGRNIHVFWDNVPVVMVEVNHTTWLTYYKDENTENHKMRFHFGANFLFIKEYNCDNHEVDVQLMAMSIIDNIKITQFSREEFPKILQRVRVKCNKCPANDDKPEEIHREQNNTMPLKTVPKYTNAQIEKMTKRDLILGESND